MMTSNPFPEVLIHNRVMDDFSVFSSLWVSDYQQVMIITDTQVASLYLEKLVDMLKLIPKVKQIDFAIIPQGEDYKTLESAEKIFTQLIEHHHYRDTILIALGGGMIGDLTGFCAACYLRGVTFIQMPTTLLAQVDAAIGGKTAVNHPLGKNLIGAFYQPKKIIADISFLESLPQREFIAGLAEVIKYGLALDADFFSWLENNWQAILGREPASIEYLVRHCAHLKMDIVSKDEREQGDRIFLNFGHTVAHALEAILQFKGLSHGEAVSIGLLAAVALSEKVCQLESTLFTRLKKLLSLIGLPTDIPHTIQVNELLQAMLIDKKNKKHTTQWVLLTSLGQPIVVSNLSQQCIEAVLVQLGAQA